MMVVAGLEQSTTLRCYYHRQIFRNNNKRTCGCRGFCTCSSSKESLVKKQLKELHPSEKKRCFEAKTFAEQVSKMAEMNLAGLPANPQEDCQYIQLKTSLYKLQLSLTEYFCTILTIYHHGQKSSFQDSSFIQIERPQRLALENPKEQELQTASFIRKEMDRILNHLAHHGRVETAPNRELLDIFKCLWTYFQLNEGAGAQRDPDIPSFDRIYQPSSQYHAQEWGETVLCNRGLKEDCEVVTQILAQQTGLLKTSGQIETSEELNQSLTRIHTYLKQKTIKPSPSRPTSYEADEWSCNSCN